MYCLQLLWVTELRSCGRQHVASTPKYLLFDHLQKKLGLFIEQSFFSPALLSYNWHITLCKCKVYGTCWIESHILWYDFHHGTLASSPSLHIIMSFFAMRTIKIYPLSNLQVCETVLLTIITMPCSRSRELANLITETLCPHQRLPTHHPYPSPWQPPLYSVSMSSAFLHSTYVWPYSVCLSLSDLFHLAQYPHSSFKL